MKIFRFMSKEEYENYKEDSRQLTEYEGIDMKESDF